MGRDENENTCANVRKTDIGGEGVGRDENENMCANVRKTDIGGGGGEEKYKVSAK